jgi:hypothetical protein
MSNDQGHLGADTNRGVWQPRCGLQPAMVHGGAIIPEAGQTAMGSLPTVERTTTNARQGGTL